jgi:hypothetical protein
MYNTHHVEGRHQTPQTNNVIFWRGMEQSGSSSGS